MFEGARLDAENYLNAGALLWFVGFLVHYLQPWAVSARGSGYVYGALALVGGVFVGVGLTRVDLPTRESEGTAVRES